MDKKLNNRELLEKSNAKLQRANHAIQNLMIKYMVQVNAAYGSFGLEERDLVGDEFFNEDEFNILNNLKDVAEKVEKEETTP